MEINYHYENAMPRQLDSQHRYKNRIGFWGDVIDVNSSNNTCSVVSDQGLEYIDIQVATTEWTNKAENKNFVACEKNLPPIGARVFVLVPNGNMASAFILCSGYPINETEYQTLFTKVDENKSDEENQKEIEKKNIVREKIKQSGWHEVENYETGNLLYESQKSDIKLEINLIKDDDNSQEKQILLKFWDNEIVINPDDKEINLTILNNELKIKEGEITIESGNNKIELTSDGVDINGYLSVKAKV